ncbi:hypothetical protein [Sinosporangium siamense]|uniref:hypothetical protein n=1 Tax=Sinosporangium siamense TaxID=1367973 RepID=UPI00194EAE9D|nr:hypothetical protein [Sinosporangium siamense]
MHFFVEGHPPNHAPVPSPGPPTIFVVERLHDRPEEMPALQGTSPESEFEFVFG